jgi:hypothetical protein
MSAEVVQFPGQRRRVANVTAEERCPACENDAWVEGDDGAAPCPCCERGFRLEFGIGRMHGAEFERPEGGPWGKQGYWANREIPEHLRS